MSETIAPPAAAPIAAPAPVVAPVAAPAPTPVVQPVVEAAPVVAPVEAAPAPVIETPAPEPTTVMGDALKPAPVEPTPVPEAAPIPEGQTADPAPPPVFDAFALPAGLTFKEGRIGEFTNLLGSFETETKADHAKVQALGQQLLDRHVAEMQGALAEAQRATAAERDARFTGWKDQFLQDPEIGGNRWQTTIDSAREFIRTHGGTEAQQAEFRAVMDETGVGNHPAFIRLLANAGVRMSEGRPLAGVLPASAPLTRTQKLYGKGG